MNKKTHFKTSNIIFIALALFMLIFSISSALAVPMQTINDSNVYLSIEQSRIGSGYVYIELQPKKVNASYDIAFGFDSDDAIPLSLEIWQNNYSVTSLINGSNRTLYYENWTSMIPDGNVQFNFDSKNKWYYFLNRVLNTNKKYIGRMNLEVKGNGKYDYAMKLSSDTFQNAVSNNRFYYVDPWFENISVGLQGNWEFDELSGTLLIDNHNSTTDNNASAFNYTLTNWTTVPNVGYGKNFKGVPSSNYTMPGVPALQISSNDFTLLFVLNRTESSTGNTFFASYPQVTYTGFDLQTNTNNLRIASSCDGTSWNGMLWDTIALPLGNPFMLTIVRAGSLVKVYINGTQMSNNTLGCSALNSNVARGWSNWWNGGAAWVGTIYKMSYWNKAITQDEITNIYNNGNYSLYPFNAGLLSIVFDKQQPTNLTTTNVLNSPMNITYNITSGNNITSTILYFNSTQCSYVLGNLSCGIKNVSATSNISSTYLFRLFDNQIYPATYNFDERTMENTIHVNQSIGANANTFIKNNITNISNQKYGFLELMVHNESSTPLSIYVCNNSYSSGLVTGDPNCALLASLIPADYNHCHSNFSCHHVIPFPIINNNINGVGVTNKMYFLLRGGSSWNYFNIANDTGKMQTTSNGGNTWSALAGTFDSHLHQFDNTSSLMYWACANDTVGGTCSAVVNQIFGQTILPPTQPTILAPNSSSVVNGTFVIQYLPSTSSTGNVTQYSINLYDTTYSFLSVIYGNNDGNVTFRWNASSIANGNYVVGVTASTSDNQSSTGFSEIFEIANPVPPPPPQTTAEAIISVGKLMAYILFILLGLLAYFASFFIGVIGRLFLMAFSIALFISAAIVMSDADLFFLTFVLCGFVAIHFILYLLLIASGDVSDK